MLDNSLENNREGNVAQYVLEALKQEGIGHIFLVPGYNIDPFVESHSRAGVEVLVAAHEGGAAYMADGYARASQGFGVCMGLGGPGLTNMVTAIAAAYLDRSPVLVVSGSLTPAWTGDGTFQDSSATGIDDLDIMRPITVWAQRVPEVFKKPEDSEGGSEYYEPKYEKVKDFLHKAVRAMRGVENRPVFLSFSKEMLSQRYTAASYKALQLNEPMRILDQNAVQKIPSIFKGATRVVILAGNGCVRSGAGEDLKTFAKKFDIPIVTTLRAKGVVSEDPAEFPLSFGFFGNGGTLQANKVVMGSSFKADDIPKAEVLIVLGATLNETNTYAWNEDFPPSKSLVRVDINPNNVFGKNYDETLVVGDAREFLHWLQDNESLFETDLRATQLDRQNWLENIRKTPYYDLPDTSDSDDKLIHPALVTTELRKAAPHNAVLVVDSGAHSYHVPHHWSAYAPNEFLMLTNTGPMGYGVSVGIGAWSARPCQPCVAIVGDGSLLMHGMEIKTAVRYCIPLVVIVINNSALGNIYLRATEDTADNPRWPEKAVDAAKIPTIDCVSFARSLGADGVVVERSEHLAEAYTKAFRETQSTRRPFVVDVRCCRDCPVPNNAYASDGASALLTR
ncbi:MAG: thiamine pyrophosphate-binding protein [Phormidesmis sp.]